MSPASINGFDLQQAVSRSRLIGLWRLLTGFRPVYIVATVSLGLAAISKTTTYLLLRYFIDRYLGAGDRTWPLGWIAGGFIALAVLEGGFTFASGRLAAYTAEGIALRLRNYLFDHIQRLSFAYHDQIQTGELISRSTSDVDALRRFFADQAIGFGRIILLFGVNLTAVFFLEPRLTAISVAVVPLIVGMSIFFFRRVYRVYEAYQEQEATLSTTLQENLTGVRVVKAFARQDHEREKFNADNWEKFQRGKRFLTMHSLFWPVTDILSGGQLLLGFYLGARMAIGGQISVGTYMAYAGMLVWLIFPMRNLGRMIVQMSTGLVSFGRVMEIIAEPREDLISGSHAPEQGMRGEVVFEQVSFIYRDQAPALNDISFRCRPGQVVALLGSTGSGKTSLVNLLPRFYDYTSGSVTLDGVELRRYPRRYLREQIGIVEQEPFLFSRTVRENITYGVGRQVEQAEVEAAARAAAMHEVILSFPQAYDTLVGEKGVTLSGGQKQRVAIARTLLKDPRILILDDSTSSVDTETEEDIREALKVLMRGRTTFIIAHRIQSVMEADLILVMDKGRVVQTGRHEELVRRDGMYRRIYELQARIEDELQKEIASV
jgi:ATP-binding cassette, subfamily B, bacterial